MNCENIVVLDIGNSMIKAYVSEHAEKEFVRFWHAEYELLETFLYNVKPQILVVSCVAQRIRKKLEPIFERSGAHIVDVTSKESELVDVAFDTQNELGADILCNLTAAANEYPNKNVLIIDNGTANTYAVLTKDGVFHGVSIGVGLTTSLKALTKEAEALSSSAFQIPKSILSFTTSECIQSGILLGYVHKIMGMIHALANEFALEYVIITGGHTQVIKDVYKKHQYMFVETQKTRLIFDETFTVKGGFAYGKAKLYREGICV